MADTPVLPLGDLDKTNILDDITAHQLRIIVDRIIDGSFDKSQLGKGIYTPVYVDGRDIRLSKRLVSPGQAQDIDGFYELLYEAFNDRLDRENIAEPNRPILTEEFPPTDARSETISLSLISREPATISQGKILNREVQAWKPRLREIVPDVKHPNKKLYVYGQPYDNVIELKCWSRTNKVANRRALWLERFVNDYKWFFKYKGVSEVLFMQRLADQHVEIEDNKWHCRPLHFFVRTERMGTLSTYTLTRLLLSVDIEDSID